MRPQSHVAAVNLEQLGPEVRQANLANYPPQHHGPRGSTSTAANRHATLPGAGVLLSIHALDPVALINLQRLAGNQAVGALLKQVQRAPLDIGWTDASKEGKAWNAGQREVGEIHRIPLEGLDEGLQQEKAWRFGKQESTKIPELSSESAAGKAIVLVPKSINPNAALKDPTAKIEVVIFLHGHTENTGRPFAGWRALELKLKKGEKEDDFVHSLRQGIDEKDPWEPKDTAPVRDVALDQAEQQLQESGNTQTIMVLPQGGLHSQFGKKGDTDFDSNAYVNEIISRLEKKEILKTKASANALVGRVTMAGHSGAGATLARMARESVRRDQEAKAATSATPGRHKPRKKHEPFASSALTGDLVIFDAINEGQLEAFTDWALMRLNNDLDELKKPGPDADKLKYLRAAPKLRGYYSTGKHGKQYKSQYLQLQDAIDRWFKRHASELGTIAGCLHANFVVNNAVPVSHEELMRGVAAGTERAGKGSILDALKALHRATFASLDACPVLPASATPDVHPARKHGKRHSGALEEEKQPAALRH